MFFSGLSDHKYVKFKENLHNSYLVGVNILPQTYDAVLCMKDGLKPTTTNQNYSGREQKDKADMAFVIPAEVKENKSVGMAKSPQSEAVAGVQKNMMGP